MMAEISIVPAGVESMSRYIADVIKVIEASGLKYKVNPMGTVIEGPTDEVFDVIKRAHKTMLNHAGRVLTQIKIDDRKNTENAMERKIESLEQKLGRKISK